MGLYNYLMKWHLVEIILSALMAHRNIFCLDNGTQWGYKSVVGSFFFNFHCVGCLVAAAMVRVVLTKSMRKNPIWLFEQRDLVLD